MGFLYDHDARDPLGPLPPDDDPRRQRIRALEASGVTLCYRTPLTDADLDTAEWFMAWLEYPGHVPYDGCARCERVTSLDLEPGQVASCGQHSYVRKGEPRD